MKSGLQRHFALSKYISDRFRWLLWGGLLVFLGLCAAALIGTRDRFWLGIVCSLLVVAAALTVFGYFRVWRPYRETTRVLGDFFMGSMLEQLEQIRYPYNPQMANALTQMRRYMEQASTLEASKRQAQYQALQNQINPHFLYNTLESIRSEAVLSGLDSVDAMCEALANFFRYTISNMENIVTVREELSNIRNYFTIQQYRFEDRLQLRVESEDMEEACDCLIPKLTLQPIVENAIVHGLERRVGVGTVTVRLILTGERLLILVSDDGLGMDQETLGRIKRDIAQNRSGRDGRGGIAIGNVNNRIQLLFGEEYGVTVFSTVGAGTDVEIALPKTTQLDRAKYLDTDRT